MKIKALDLDRSYNAINLVNLWFKLRNNEQLVLSDIPELIRFRWSYFRNNWNFIKEKYEKKIPTAVNADLLIKHINSFNEFIINQITVPSTKNPLADSLTQEKFWAIFDNTNIDDLVLTYEEQTLFDNKIKVVKNYSRNDFIYLRSILQQQRDDYIDYNSATDETYNEVYNRSPADSQVEINTKAINNIYQLQQSIKSIDFILANIFSLETATINPFELARQNANNQEVEIGQYVSGQLTTLHYGETLQALAKRTLGDPNKWIDIAIANGLKPPYIDEEGESLYLLATAEGNQINIGSTSTSGDLNVDKLYINQIVLLQSDTQPFPEQRVIVNIKEVPVSGELIIELNGDDNLDRYTLGDNAYIRIFKANTINSSFYILIPSEQPLTDEIKSDTPWFLQTSSETEKRQKIDLSLDDKTGDLQLNSTSDLSLRYGIDNAVQAMKMKIAIRLGELQRHSDYGLIEVEGSSNQDIDIIKNLVIDSITKNIQDDNRFDRIERLDVYDMRAALGGTSVSTEANGLYITLSVRLAGSNTVIPISFKVNI